MDMSWITTSLTWYLYLFAIGLIFFPITAKVFSIFYDKGYAFAKTIGIIGLSYIIFLLGILKIVPFSQESIFFTLLILAFVIYRYFPVQIQDIKKLSRKRKLALVGEEILFLISFIALTFIRGQEPTIRGLEKFMDFGFMQSINRSDYFPPLDMWLSSNPDQPEGYPINYYYFGHLSGALLTKLTGISPYIGYNLILATIFAQGITLAYSLTSNIVYVSARYVFKKALHPAYIIGLGLLGTFLVNLAGNLHTIYLLTTGYPNEQPQPFWGIFQSIDQISTTMKSSGTGLLNALVINSKYWYPNATRFIPYTIHEFPSYSYVVADLHGHVFDIPFVLVTLAFLFIFFFRISMPQLHGIAQLKNFVTHKLFRKQRFIEKNLSRFNLSLFEVGMSILIGFMIAVNYMTNAFDGPIYFLLAMGIFFLVYRFSLKAGILTVLLGISFVVFSLPFSFFFKPFASGIGVNCSPGFLVDMKELGPFLFEKGNCQVSSYWMLFILWGFFLISALLYGVSQYLYYRKEKKWFTTLDFWIIGMYGFGTFLILIPEFFYIKDIYPAHFRANTMFKMGYQAFIMMSITSAIILYKMSMLKSKWKYLLKALYIPFLFLVDIYPFLAFPSYYPSLGYAITHYRKPVLDGSLWMVNDMPQDKEIIDYINNRIPGQPNILEAQGDSYTDYDRVSAYTGLPTVAGWWVHQWLWRGSADIVGARIPDIEALYQSEDIEYTKDLIEKYDIEYVVVSDLERQKYPKLNEAKFEKIGNKIFESNNGSGALYQVY